MICSDLLFYLQKHYFHFTSMSSVSDDGMGMCWSKHEGSLGVKI